MVRVAFVGDPQRFSTWALGAPAGGLVPAFFAAGARGTPGGLAAFRPHVVVVLDVDAVPEATYADLDAAVLGVAAPDLQGYGRELALPALRAVSPAPPAPPAPADPPAPSASSRVSPRSRVALRILALLRRIAPARVRPRLGAAGEWRAAQLPAPASSPWDRLVALDTAAAGGRPLWRLIAPPVDDRLYRPARLLDHRAQVIVAAPSTAYRERLLTDAKHLHDVRHIAHGVTPETLPELLGGADVAIAIRPHEGAGFEHDIAVHLAAGHLVLCDRLDPTHGLEPGIDVLEARDGPALAHLVGAVVAAPGVHHRVRVRGHQKAERFRASRVWPELIADLLADLEAFG
jgi:hypothetical protein